MWAVGTDSMTVLNRDVTLEIKDDATYRLTLTRSGERRRAMIRGSRFGTEAPSS